MKMKKNITNLEQHLVIDEQTTKGAQNFRYLDALINSKNLMCRNKIEHFCR
jgi:hypothetical protein